MLQNPMMWIAFACVLFVIAALASLYSYHRERRVKEFRKAFGIEPNSLDPTSQLLVRDRVMQLRTKAARAHLKQDFSRERRLRQSHERLAALAVEFGYMLDKSRIAQVPGQNLKVA